MEGLRPVTGPATLLLTRRAGTHLDPIWESASQPPGAHTASSSASQTHPWQPHREQMEREVGIALLGRAVGPPMVGLVSALRKADRGPSRPTQVRGTCREAQEQRQSTGCKAPGPELVE